MGLLLSRSHLHCVDNSPQSAFYTDRGGGAQRRMTFQTNQLLLSRILISGLVYKHECDLSERNDGTVQSANISNLCIHIA